MRSLKRLLKYSQKYKSDYVLGFIYSVLNKFFDIAPEILIGMAIDVVVSKKDSTVAKLGFPEPKDQLLFLGALTLVIWVCESTFEYLYNLKWKGLAQKIQHEARMDLYRHLQNLEVLYFESKSSGSLVTIVNDDVNQLERFLNYGASHLIQIFTTVILIGGTFIVLSPKIALVSFMPIPFIILGAFYFQRKAEPLYAEVREHVSRLASRLTANISGITTIKAFQRENFELSKVESLSNDYANANQKAIRVSSAFIPIVRMAVLAGFIFTFIMGGLMTLRGELNVGFYGVLVFLTQRLLWPLTGLAEFVDLYQRAMASVDRILDVLEKPLPEEPESSSEALNFSNDIKFKSVSFSYPGREDVLKNVSLTIASQKTTAIVGFTGSGKSTLVKLLMRFYVPTTGEIDVGTQHLKDFSTDEVRKHLGWVSQDVFLFDGSVFENVAYGKTSATHKEVEEACKLAAIHDFIAGLPKGYDTVVGERGQRLSGGQRQRLALARAIVRDPELLILDEATSAVDNQTEALIQEAMKKVAKNRTVLMIAHRLSTIKNADIIYVIDEGKVAEQGRHDELLQLNGLYFKLWNLQLRESYVADHLPNRTPESQAIK